MPLRSIRLLLVGCALVLAACGGGDGNGTVVSNSAEIGAAGGTVADAGGAQVEVHAGALAQAVVISVIPSSAGAPPLPAGVTALGRAIAVTPHGTHFSLPVTVSLPFDPNTVPVGNMPVLLKTNAAGDWESVPTAIFGTDTVRATVSGFSWFQVGGLLRNDPVRNWSFSRFFENQTHRWWEPVEMPCGDDHCTQVGGLLERSIRFGPALFDHPFTLHGVVQPHDTFAEGLIAASADGVTYGVFAEAPYARRDGPDPIGSESSLRQTQSFRKVSADASLTFTVSRLLIDATDFYPVQFIGSSGGPLATRVFIFGSVELTAKAFKVPGESFYSAAGTAELNGLGNSWEFVAFGAVGAPVGLWGDPDFDLTTLPIIETNGAITGCPGTGVTLSLRAPRTYSIDLSSVVVGEEFTLEFIAKARTYNRKGGGFRSECQMSSVSAFLRDPIEFGGTTLHLSGLEPTHRPLTPAPEAPSVPAGCVPGPGGAAEAGTLQFDAASFTVDEFAWSVPTVKVIRSGGSAGAVSVTLTTSDGTAVAGIDYVPVDGAIHFADGDDSPRRVKVPTLHNPLVGPDRSLNLTLSRPGGCATLGAQTSAVLTIRDDAPAATYSLGGTVSGLLGTGLALEGPFTPITLSANGAFTFPEAMLDGLNYNVRVATQPGAPAQLCSVGNGSGTIAGANVTNIQVECVTPPTTGGLDPGFGVAGKVFNSDFESSPVAVGLQRSGKIVVGGSTTLSRFNPDGGLDTTFGSGGWLDVAFHVDSSTLAQSLTVQPDDKILVVGTARVGTRLLMAVARYMPDGALDTAFGNAGLTTVDPYAVLGAAARNSTARRALVAADGRIYVAGNAGAFISPNNINNFAIARLNADGSPDTSYSGDGVQTTPVGSRVNYPYAIGIQADGKAVLAGAASDTSLIGESGIGLARFKTNGSLDTDDPKKPDNYGLPEFLGYSLVDPSLNLGTSGGVSTDVDMVMLPDDSLVVAASVRATDPTHGTVRRMTLIRVGVSGNIVHSGVVPWAIGPGPADDLVHALVRLGDGRFVMVGQVSPTGNLSTAADFAVLRFNADLTPDTSFAGNGVLLLDFFGGIDSAVGVAEQADGKLLVVGSARNGLRTGIGIARLQ